MEKFIEEASSLYWWIAVVIVGIVINIISSYARKFLENSLSDLSDYWRTKKNERAEAEEKKINLLKNNHDLRIIFALRESRYRIRSFMFTVFAWAMLFASQYLQTTKTITIILLTSSSILLLMGLSDHRAAMKIKHLVESSTEGLDELDT